MDEQHTTPQNNATPDPYHKPREEDDYRAASEATANEEAYDDYTKQGATYTAPSHKSRKFLVSLLVVILVAGLAFGAYWMFLRKDKADTTKKTATSSSSSSSNSSDMEKNASFASETEHHTSAQFMLEFDYPKDWKVSDEAGSGKLTATSPGVMLKDAAGKSYMGQVLLTVRNKQQALPEFDKGNAVAAVESTKINYAKPSQAQRAATYISFLRYATSTSSKALDGVYITGDVGYKKDQAIPKADFTPVDPIISITFMKCSNENCSGTGTAAAIESSMWSDATFGKPLQTMLQSLIVN
jgi:hypothetical protein